MKKSDYYYDAVMWAVSHDPQITTGKTNMYFAPDDTCTRCEVMTFIWRAMGKPVVSMANPFVDVSPSAYYYDAVMWAVKNGITTGTDSTHFSPDNRCSRGQVLTFLWRMKDQPIPLVKTVPFTDVSALDSNGNANYYYIPVRWAVGMKMTSFMTGTEFKPDNPCPRGMTMAFLYGALK